jgi:hypothetical protein
MTNLTKTALDMATADIRANRLPFRTRTTLADAREIFLQCLRVAKWVQVREMGAGERELK